MSLKSISIGIRSSVRDIGFLSREFSVLATDEERVRFCYNFFRDELKELSFKRIGKCAEKSIKLRETGNVYFRKGDSWKAMILYNESIANAPNDSEELCLAYGNRAAALLRLNLVTEALNDVEKALSMNIITDSFKRKMLERKEKCLKSTENKLVIVTGCEEVELPTKSSYIESASAVVGIRSDDIFGRSLFAYDDIKTGEVLIVEKPFSSILVSKQLYTHCAFCFTRCFNLIPCPNCVTSMYCSLKCLKESSQSHLIECKILEVMVSLEATCLQLLSVKVLTDACKQGETLRELAMEVSEYDKNNDKTMYYKSSDHINIYKLTGHTNKRSLCDLFLKSINTCVILTVLDNFSDIFDNLGEEKDYFIGFAGGIILRYLQSMPCNAHEISEFCENGYKEIGAGVFATLSLINHSCDPNVVRHSHKDVLVLRAIRPIKKGEQLLDNYGYHYALLNSHERQSLLFRQYFFRCKCEACVNNWPLQQNLPRGEPIYKPGADVQEYKLLTEKFKKIVNDIIKEDFDKDIINDLINYLNFLDEFVERPWKAYNICQEAIKHCLGFRGNSFHLSKVIKHAVEEN